MALQQCFTLCVLSPSSALACTLHSHPHCTHIRTALASTPHCTRIRTALHSHLHFASPPQHTPLRHPFMHHPAALAISPGLALSLLLLMMKACPPLAMPIASKLLNPQAFPNPIQIRTWPGETDPNPNLARRNRSESEPSPAKPIRIRTQEKQSEPGACLPPP